MSVIASNEVPVLPSGRRRTVLRVGLTLAGIMSSFNLVNGSGSLIDPRFGQTDPSLPPQPAWVSAALVLFGAITLAALIPAWRGSLTAAVVVVISRLAEGWSGLVMPFLPDAPDGLLGPMVLLACVATVVAAMVAQALIRPS